MTIQITRSDIEAQRLCPVATALRRYINKPFAVGLQYLLIEGHTKIKWPAKITEFLQRSDNGVAVEPMEFNIHI